MFKANGKYHITGAEFVPNPDGGRGSDYHCYAAMSDNLFGPYGEKYLAIPHAGHNSFFKDKDGQCHVARGAMDAHHDQSVRCWRKFQLLRQP